VRAVEDYVDALKARDFDRAMSLRCSAARIGQRDRELFLTHLGELVEEIGPIEGVEARVVPSSGLRPVADLSEPIEVEYSVVSGGGTHDPLLTVVVTEGSGRRMCAFATGQAKRLIDKFPALEVAPEISLPPRSLLTFPFQEGQKEEYDRALRLGASGALDGWERAWRIGATTSVRVEAVRFASEAAAFEFAFERVRSSNIPNGVNLIDFGDGSPFIGSRILSSAWLWLQPPDSRPYIDSAVAVYGDVSVSILVARDLSEDHDIVVELVRSIEARVGAQRRA